jgi:hypothetical protein
MRLYIYIVPWFRILFSNILRKKIAVISLIQILFDQPLLRLGEYNNKTQF